MKILKSLFLTLSAGTLILSGIFTSCKTETTPAQKTPVDYADPLIGTAHCRWFHFAPGALPFGLAKPGASTNGSLGNKGGWEASGYDYRDNTIEGFPCFHEFQIGGVVLMPTRGTLATVPGTVGQDSTGYRSAFTHERETARPGYYSVMLDRYGIQAELTATERVAFQRYTFPADKQSNIIFDIGNQQGESGKATAAKVWITDGDIVEGWVETAPEYCKKYQSGAKLTMYFSAIADRKAEKFGTFIKDSISAGGSEVEGIGSGAYLSYGTQEGEQITVKVGLSYTSVENARLNRSEETGNDKLTFDQAAAAARDRWNEHLGRIAVETVNDTDKVKFYTGLYHAILGRGIANDINGAYPKNDGTIGQIPLDSNGRPEFAFHNSDAMWGAPWNLVQLWALAYPEHLSDMVSTQIQIYKDGGWLADGIACSRYVSGVGTNQLGNMIAAAYLCGIRDYDVEHAYQAALKNEIGGEDRPLGAGKVDTDRFTEYGYVPHRDKGEWPDEAWRFSASHTLEYSFGCYAVGQMAQAMGKTENISQLDSLSYGWRKIFDTELQLVRPKTAEGRFIDDFDPMEVWRGFQEGNAYQYTFYVPHHADSLIHLIGKEEFVQRLDKIFEGSRKDIFSGGTVINAFSGLETRYNHGNQPCLHISWLFNEAQKPSLTQKWVRAILNEFYGTEGIHGYGYGQDEDQGQLGAWYVLSSIGLFDPAGLAEKQPQFSLGSPLFDKVTVRLNPDYYKGETFSIECTGEGEYAGRYIFGNDTLTTPEIDFGKIVSGGRLLIERSVDPVDRYGK